MNEFARFVLVGVTNSAIGYSVIFGLMLGAGWSPELSNVTGYGVGLAASYVLHRTFTFESRAKPLGEVTRFLIVFFFAFGLNLLALTFLVRVLGVADWLSQVIAGVIYVVSSYSLNRALVFRSSARNYKDASQHVERADNA